MRCAPATAPIQRIRTAELWVVLWCEQAELLAAFRFAKKKTRATITVSLSQLEGAAIMNNTFVRAAHKDSGLGF